MRAILSVIFTLSVIFQALASEVFPLPSVPDSLVTTESRANYLALHYWDNVDFCDPTIIGNEDISEQGFSNFISIMPYVTQKEVAFAEFVSKISLKPDVQDYFMAVAKKYLAESQSPVFNDELYIAMLQSILSSDLLDSARRSKYEILLETEMKNRVGTVASDFEYMLHDGTRGRLSDIDAKYILIFFSDPTCDRCNLVKEKLNNSATIRVKLIVGDLAILSVCVEGNTDAWKASRLPDEWIDACDEKGAIYDQELYDIPGLPSFYLLDSSHRVILRDVHFQLVENFLDNN
jgi:thioredoxin-related protein